ncbi:hypothetical protein BESB_054380 [Besnoitia besnoiti]|uniref:Transmembrane protein n=1 Tax=Besnoitia besnoiti TaxID=94643 RepID=A0A2A9MJL4_BESBE|nr:hypothetical protein BESB_054380 [Besnoitia besnoiti]PFH35787.1 hypothetical protein BESB_054380 [Besnoitia besnoiti]
MARLACVSVPTIFIFLSVAFTSLRPLDTDRLAGGDNSIHAPHLVFGTAKIRGPLARAARRGITQLGRNVTKSVRRIGRRAGLRILQEEREPEVDSRPLAHGKPTAAVAPAEGFLGKGRSKHHKSRPLSSHKGKDATVPDSSSSTAHHMPTHVSALEHAHHHETAKVIKKQRPRYIGQTTVIVDKDARASKDGGISRPPRKLQTVYTPIKTPASVTPVQSASYPSAAGPSDFARRVLGYSQQMQGPAQNGAVFPVYDVVGSAASVVNGMGLPSYSSNPPAPSGTDVFAQRGMPSYGYPIFPQDGLTSVANSLVQTLAAGPQSLLRSPSDAPVATDFWGLGELGNVITRNTNNLLQAVGIGAFGGW